MYIFFTKNFISYIQKGIRNYILFLILDLISVIAVNKEVKK